MLIDLGHVAQLDRASDSGSEGRGFESLRARLCSNVFVAISNAFVEGSFVRSEAFGRHFEMAVIQGYATAPC